MNFCSFYLPINPTNNRQDETASFIRILHASPDAPPVDVYVNNNLLAKDISYRDFTKYLSLFPGLYNIKVFPADSITNPVVDVNINIPGNSIFTVAAIGRLSQTSLHLIQEPIIQRIPGKVYVRFAHLSPDATKVDITLPNGTELFRDVNYKGVTDYISVNPGVYNFQARISGTDNIILRVPNIKLLPNKFYTIYAIGLTIGKPTLQVLIPLDGNSYLKH